MKVPEGRASKAVTGKTNGSSPLGLSRVTVSRMGWLRGRNLKIWAKDRTLKTQRRRLNRSRGQANLGGLAPSRPRRGQRLAVRGWDVASERRGDAAGFRQSLRRPDPQGIKASLTRASHWLPKSRERKEQPATGSRGNCREVKAA